MYDDEIEALNQCNTIGIVLVSALIFAGTFLMLEIIELINKVSGSQKCGRQCGLDYRYTGKYGPQTWGKTYPACNSKAQSPVNIDTKTSTSVELSEPLLWKNYDKLPVSMMLKNTGHTVQLTAQWVKGCEPIISGGVLGEKTFMFQEINLRWGRNDTEGSEHSVDFDRYALEMQLIHSNTTNPSELACVSYMFQISCKDNPLLNYLLNGLWEIISPGIATWINPFPLRCILHTFSYKYYSYCGSLTYPPCTENVLWIINPESMSISSRQIAKLRKLHGQEGPIYVNSRPLQCLNDRLMYYFRS